MLFPDARVLGAVGLRPVPGVRSSRPGILGHEQQVSGELSHTEEIPVGQAGGGPFRPLAGEEWFQASGVARGTDFWFFGLETYTHFYFLPFCRFFLRLASLPLTVALLFPGLVSCRGAQAASGQT